MVVAARSLPRKGRSLTTERKVAAAPTTPAVAVNRPITVFESRQRDGRRTGSVGTAFARPSRADATPFERSSVGALSAR